MNKNISIKITFLLTAMFTASACNKPQEPDCIPAQKIVKIDTDMPTLKIQKRAVRHAKDADHCQVCVMSPKRFISCQRIWADHGENRDEIKVKATEKACKDAGYPYTCPKKAIMSVFCKGDPLPESAKNGGMALQKIHFMSKTRPKIDSDSSKTDSLKNASSAKSIPID